MIPRHINRSTALVLIMTTAYATYVFHAQIADLLTYVDLNVIKPHETFLSYFIVYAGIIFVSAFVVISVKWFWWEPRQLRRLKQHAAELRANRQKKLDQQKIEQIESSMLDCFIMFLRMKTGIKNMKFYRAIRYVHASRDGRKTLCGQLISPTCVNVWLWTEVESLDATLRPCPKCKKKMISVSSKQGRQTQIG